MSAWGTRRQLSFVLVFILLIIFALVALIALNKDVPTCTDGVANQAEIDVDCGGPCIRVCSVEANEVAVLWSRVFHVRDGLYDVGAYLENPNPFGLPELAYKVRIYDTDNVPVKDVEGKIYLNPHERALIFVPSVDLGFRTPTRAFISFPNVPVWQRLKSDIVKPTITIRNQKIDRSKEVLSLSAEVVNDSDFAVANLELYALLYDKNANVVHVSSSLITELDPAQTSPIIFTWPLTETLLVESADILPRVNLVDKNILVGELVAQ